MDDVPVTPSAGGVAHDAHAQLQSSAADWVRRADAASFLAWETEGATMQEAHSPAAEVQANEPPAVEPRVVHTSWCASVGCKGNCCITAVQSGAKPRSGERARLAHSRAVQQAAVRQRAIPDGTDGRELTAAQVTLAKMLAKVRAPRHDPALCTACGHEIGTVECCKS